MPKKLILVLSSVLIALTLFFLIKPQLTRADQLDDITKQLSQLNDELNKSVKATKPVESELKSMQARIASIKNQIPAIENDIVYKKKAIDDGYKKLADKEKIINITIRDFYIKSYNDSPLLIFLSLNNASDATQAIAYQHAKTKQDKAIITNIAISIIDLEKKKSELIDEQKSLVVAKASLDDQAVKLDKIVSGAKNFQNNLSGKIADLSAKQQQIINSRSGGFNANINDVAGDSSTSLSSFNNNASGGSFGIFSFGAYTHRNGMSQYGAYGRATKGGQNYEQILKYYYHGIELKKVDNPQITVYGTNTYGQTFNDENFSLEDYLKHIYEVPSSWPADVLKAQAIAARSFAYGKPKICSGQQCQEFKREENADSWKQAVKDTEGMVMSGGPGSYQYSSTTGGWINGGVGWDTTDGNGGSDFAKRSYENVAESPWFYKAWFKDDFGEYGARGSSCGRSSPWLSSAEMADIANAYLVLTKGSSEEKGRISPVTTSCWPGNPYSIDELKNVASKYGGLSNATSASVSQGEGSTNSVNINGVNMSGSEFKKAFALRAPGFIRIPQSGFAFFNIEHK